MAEVAHRFVSGAGAAMRGLKLASSSAKVRKTYAQLVLVLFAITAAFNAAGIWAVVHWTGGDPDTAWWAAVGWLLLRLAGIAMVLLISPLLAMFTVNIAFPLLAERVFFASLDEVAPARSAALRAEPGLSIGASAADASIRLLLFLALTVGMFVISLIPIVGAIVGPVLQGYFTARAMGWELLDPYFDKLGMRFDSQHDYVKRHRGAIVGFGLPFSFVMAIPFVGPLLFGLAQASAAVLVSDVLEAGGPGPRDGSDTAGPASQPQ